MDTVNREFDRAFNMTLWMAETLALQDMLVNANSDPTIALAVTSLLDQVEAYHKRGEA